MSRLVLHVDMDAFFTSIEQLDNPEYRGKPVVVGADPRGGRGRGVVSAASYEARVFGIHSALPISRAYQRCPGAIFLPPRFERYQELSDIVMNVLGTFTPLVEPISIDEAFLDCTGTEGLFGKPMELGNRIKRAIRRDTGLTASVGIASNKSVAKIASDLQKPDGLTICEPGREREFLAPLPVGRLWGAGRKTERDLESMGYHRVGDISSVPLARMEKLLGKWGEHLWLLANGIDDRPVCDEYERKSYSEETTFERDVDDAAIVEHVLFGIADTLSYKLRSEGVKGRTVTLKIRLEGFETHTKSLTLPEHVNDMETIRNTAVRHFRGFDRKEKRVRLVGIRVSNLERDGEREECQLDLFEATEKNGDRDHRGKDAERVLDSMRDRFGGKVTRATLLHHRSKNE
ncbi:MAG TPA: DNA polymerase IV [Spirochaetota bacterium]|nr:DNA polymerase IV [Spirochaetota bacterium]